MSTLLGRFLLLNVFPAFLPQAGGDDEVDYYESLSVARSASAEDIRKAYKKRSLQLHPDKILQRGGQVTDEVREEYQRVQEAYGVLNDPKKRSLYHSVGCSSVRYQFMTSGEMYNPAKLYSNLAAATTAQKSRIVLAICVLEALVLLTPILVCVKINHSLADDGGALQDADWTLLLIPLWVLQGMYVLIWFLLALISPENKCQLLLVGTEQLLWLIGGLIVSLRWDRILEGDYAVLFIPIYLALVVRWMGLVVTMLSIRRDVRRMVTLEHLESKILEGRSYEDLSEEEKQNISETYLIVNVPPHVKEMLDEEMDPEDEVVLSPEYEAAMELHNQAMAQLWRGIVFAVPTVVMLVLKIDGHLDDDVSWWLVFVPVWVYLGAQILYSLYLCCCGTMFGDEVVVVGGGENEGDSGNEEGNEEDTPAAERSSGGFAAAEGDMNDANEGTDVPDDANESTDVPEESKDDAPTTAEDKIRELNKARVEAARKSAAAAATNAATPSTPPTSTAAGATAQSSRPDDNDNNDDVEEGNVGDDEDPFMDAETFEQWQSAYQEAQESAMEAQTKAQANLCGLLFQLIMACLIVGKLEAALGGDPEQEEETDVGYNAMWILFPIFFVSGCILCCCACLIYGAQGLDGFVNQDDEEGADDNQAGGNNNTSSNNEEDSPIVMMPPPPPPPAETTTPAEPARSTPDVPVEEEKEAPSKLEEPSFDGDELD